MANRRKPRPPRAAQRPVTYRRHGHERTDPYAWLRDPGWREVMRDPSRLEPDIRAYLEQENAYTRTMMAPLEPLRKQLYEELAGRLVPDDASVPLRDRPYEYYRRFRAGGQYPIYARRRIDAGGAGEEQILLDGDREAEGSSYFRIAGFRHSPDHRLLAYAVDTNGSEIYTICVIDLERGERLPDQLTAASGDLAWAADSRTLFYTALDDEHRPRWVYRHRVGADAAAATIVYEEPDPGFFLRVSRTESGRFVLIESSDHVTAEVRVLAADTPEGAFSVIEARQPGVMYDVADQGDAWLVRTNAGGADDYKIARAPLSSPGREHWQDLVPHQPGRMIETMLVLRDFVVRRERADAQPRIVIRRSEDGGEHAVVFEEEAYEVGVVRGYEYDTAVLRFTYSSLTTPEQVYDYDMNTRERALRKQQRIPSGHDPAAYRARRVWATAHDGERIPISLVHREDTPLDGTAPLLLYGYGAYGLVRPASFSPHRFTLVDRGFVYAIAHVRGGRDRGQRWYEDGKLENKPNTFRDFIACAEHLIAAGYTAAGRVAMHGGSAGGMLVGAVLNMRPDLFGAAVANVPFVDVLTTMCDAELPLTPPEWPEWGNPIEDEVAYRTMLSYSPYDNVGAKDYPALLVTAGLTDPRVTYWEPAKWVAKLRALGRGDRPLLLKTEMGAGHGGPSGRFSYLEEVALADVFLLDAFGLAEAD